MHQKVQETSLGAFATPTLLWYAKSNRQPFDHVFTATNTKEINIWNTAMLDQFYTKAEFAPVSTFFTNTFSFPGNFFNKKVGNQKN